MPASDVGIIDVDSAIILAFVSLSLSVSCVSNFPFDESPPSVNVLSLFVHAQSVKVVCLFMIVYSSQW